MPQTSLEKLNTPCFCGPFIVFLLVTSPLYLVQSSQRVGNLMRLFPRLRQGFGYSARWSRDQLRRPAGRQDLHAPGGPDGARRSSRRRTHPPHAVFGGLLPQGD